MDRLEVFYEDESLIVVRKPAGLESQAVSRFEPDMVSRIRNHIGLSSAGGEPYVGVVHRLDKPVSGLMVYARTPKAAAALSAQIRRGQLKKTYTAVVCGKPADKAGVFVDYLLKEKGKNRSVPAGPGTPGAKRAELRYRVSGEADGRPEYAGPLALVEIDLRTGRHHQIRVQFASRGWPLWGDRKYNPNPCGRELALCASGLSFRHPATGGTMTFSAAPEGEVFARFKDPF